MLGRLLSGSHETHIALGAQTDSTLALLLDAPVPRQPTLLVKGRLRTRDVLDVDLVPLFGTDGGSGPVDQGFQDGRVGGGVREDRGDVQVAVMMIRAGRVEIQS